MAPTHYTPVEVTDIEQRSQGVATASFSDSKQSIIFCDRYSFLIHILYSHKKTIVCHHVVTRNN